MLSNSVLCQVFEGSQGKGGSGKSWGGRGERDNWVAAGGKAASGNYHHQGMGTRTWPVRDPSPNKEGGGEGKGMVVN